MLRIFTVLATLLFFTAAFPQEAQQQENPQAQQQTQQPGSDTRVSDDAFEVINNGVAVRFFQSLNSSWSFYYLPEIRLDVLEFEGDQPIVAKGERRGDSYVVNMRLFLRPAEFNQTLVESQLANAAIARAGPSTSIGQPPETGLAIAGIRLDSMLVDVDNPDDRDYFGVEASAYNSVPAAAVAGGTFDVSLSVAPEMGEEFVEKLNAGDVVLLLTITWNGITIDTRRATLRISDIEDTATFRKLKAGGADVYTVEQMGDVAASIRSDIIFEEVESLGGDVEPASLGVEDLLEFFGPPINISNQNDARLAELEARYAERFDLTGIDIEDYQPFRVSKQVHEIVNRETDLQTKQRDYLREYDAKTQTFEASAGVSYGPFGADASYSETINQIREEEYLDEEEFNEFLDEFHDITYNTEESLYRGLEIFDETQMRLESSAAITSVRVKPRLTSSVQTLTLTSANLDSSVLPPSAEAAFTARIDNLKETITALEAQINPVIGSPENGCTRVGDIQICWGQQTKSEGTNASMNHIRSYRFDFPQPFISVPTVTNGINTDGEGHAFSVYRHNIQNTYYEANVNNMLTIAGAVDYPVTMNYIAIGLWR